MEQHRTRASERIGKAGRPKVLFIEIPSDSQFRLLGGAESPEHYRRPGDIYKFFAAGESWSPWPEILRQNLGFCNMFGVVAALGPGRKIRTIVQQDFDGAPLAIQRPVGGLVTDAV